MANRSAQVSWPVFSWMRASTLDLSACICVAFHCLCPRLRCTRSNRKMPEGDTIFRTARALGRALAGRPITGFRSNYPLLTRFHDDTPLTGQQVDRVESRGKWVLIYFSGGGILVTHMLMSGSWHIYRPGERWRQPSSNMRIVLENSEDQAVGF